MNCAPTIQLEEWRKPYYNLLFPEESHTMLFSYIGTLITSRINLRRRVYEPIR
jgi:hypothetical protein